MNNKAVCSPEICFQLAKCVRDSSSWVSFEPSSSGHRSIYQQKKTKKKYAHRLGMMGEYWVLIFATVYLDSNRLDSPGVVVFLILNVDEKCHFEHMILRCGFRLHEVWCPDFKVRTLLDDGAAAPLKQGVQGSFYFETCLDGPEGPQHSSKVRLLSEHCA